ncbi:MAG: hypothetical protein ACOZFS_11890 [Thermodesulfobacteriota bacterium]
MKTVRLIKEFKLSAQLGLALVVAAILLCGCQTKQAPLSPGAATFKKEIQDCLSKLSTPLMEPVARKDIPAITATLEKVESPAVKLCSLCPFRIGVLDAQGEALAAYPSKSGNNRRNFSSYDLITKTVNSKKIQQQRFYLQDGSQLYIISAPLVREANVIGLVVIAINSEDAKKRWDLTDKDFLAMDLNT